VGIVGITWQKAAERKSGGMLQVDRTSLRRSQGILARHFPVENRGVPQKKEKEAKKETKRLVETDAVDGNPQRTRILSFATTLFTWFFVPTKRSSGIL
jgi:hypothetical protein